MYKEFSNEEYDRFLDSLLYFDKEKVDNEISFNHGKKAGFVEGKAEGKVEGKEETKKEMILRMYERNIDINEIAEISDLTLEEVKNIIEKGQ